ncbi:MAG TPA: DUF4199 domain-containing protein [Thermoanaerobaculia bacterium]|nr:DUF4199 domain-containing protein [Thermoanaerobaculia bacterium]
MKKIVLKYGLYASAILVANMAIAIPLCVDGTINWGLSEVIGYTAIVLSSLMTFLGIRSYRESHGGTITFARAFQVGILITLLASAAYVVTWEIIYYNFLPDFAEKYTKHTVDKLRATGASADAIAKAEKEGAEFAVSYKNPLINIGMTFLEVFPIGLIITLVSAAILRRKPGPGSGELAMA